MGINWDTFLNKSVFLVRCPRMNEYLQARYWCAETILPYTLSHPENDRDVSAYSGRRRLASHAQLVCFLTRSKRNTGTWRIKGASCSVYRWARSVTSRSFSGWDKLIHGERHDTVRSCGPSFTPTFLHTFELSCLISLASVGTNLEIILLISITWCYLQ